MSDGITEEPNHGVPWDEISGGLRELAAELRQHILDDRAAFATAAGRVGSLEEKLDEMAKAVAMTTRLRRAGVFLGAALGTGIAASGILDRVAHHVPWLLDVIGR
jgi:hypothetical protein